MSQVTVEQALHLAIEHQKKNEFDAAEDIYKQILRSFPDQSDALYLYGTLVYQRGRPLDAVPLLQRAIGLSPGIAVYRLNLGLVYQHLNRNADAIAEYQAAVELNPAMLEARTHLGVALSLANRHAEALQAFQEVLALAPDNGMARGNMGLALTHLQRYDEAIATLRTALTQAPRNADFHSALATALYRANQPELAAASCRQAIFFTPDHGPAYLTLSKALQDMRQPPEALDAARHAANFLPDIVDAQVNYGELLRSVGKFDDCAALYQKALTLHPTSAELHNNLGQLQKDQGDLAAAIASFRHALALRPDPLIHSNLLYALQYDPSIPQADLFHEHQLFNERHILPLAHLIQPHTNDRSPTRRLRIAYISPDFRLHALGLYLLPIFSHHDKSQVELFCYADVTKPDALTNRLRQYADHWIDSRTLTHKALADRIRADHIDILIDLHMHMGGNRPLVFAQQPAPVQIAFAAYPGTSGLSCTHYRLTDPHLEPPTAPAIPSTETPIQLPDTFWCYFPQGQKSPVSPLPALTNNHITFGSLNNLCKINPPLLALWSKVLTALPTSKLLLLTDPGSHRDRLLSQFASHHITPDRIEFVPRQPAAPYFRTYHRIDIGLDTFPYNGHTTSLDSFFMGVPVITLVGNTPVSRAGLSQLTNLNLTELAATTEEQFVQLATTLANDLPRLQELRTTLRDRLTNSPLMDAPKFTHSIETAYRTAWQQWCDKKTQTDIPL